MTDFLHVPPTDSHGRWFEEIWRTREENIYPRLFGRPANGIFRMTDNILSSLCSGAIDPRWKTILVLRFPGSADTNWIYATSGLSNPWGVTPENARPENFSGLGFEFFMKVGDAADFVATQLLWLAAVQTLVGCGQLSGELVGPFDRVPLGRPVAAQSELDALFIFPPDDLPGQFQLLSGKVDLLCVTAVSAAECTFARSQGGEALLALLQHHEQLNRTNISRASVI